VSRALAISAFGSNSGKTLLTTALLYHFRSRVRAFKVGPDFIDPQFHKRVSGLDSINLDSFIMSEEQIRWIFERYSDQEFALVEGVMGFYDGEDRGCSTHLVTNYLQIPTILIIDCSGSYITISAQLKGLREYKSKNQIRGVVLNRISSQNHFKLIKDILLNDHPDILVFGWVKKSLPSLRSRHLGLDLEDLSKIEQISQEVLENINTKALEDFAREIKNITPKEYPFPSFQRQKGKKLAVVNDKNFSFLYYDNLMFFKEAFDEVLIIDSTKDEQIPADIDSIFICGGYVESDLAYSRIKDSHKFRKSLISHHQKGTKIYGECAGLLYLGQGVDKKSMSGILDAEFELQERFVRLGYYYNEQGLKGHCFHYTKPTKQSLNSGFDRLSKRLNNKGEVGSWKKGKSFGTFFHTMFRVYPHLILDESSPVV
jgi:cobyrinic acid a,c-diamide synthase